MLGPRETNDDRSGTGRSVEGACPRAFRRLRRGPAGLTAALVGLAAAAGCDAGDAVGRPVVDAYAVPEAVYCDVAGNPSLAAWHRDVVTFCEDGRLPGDAHGDLPPCRVAVIEDGRLRMTTTPAARAAFRLASGGLLVHTVDGALVRIERGGERSTVAPRALAPAASDDGTRVAYLEPLPSVDADGQPVAADDEDAPTRVVLWDARSGRTRVASEDRHASAAYPIPGSDDVLLVSTRTGLASIWRAAVRGGEVQLTNVGQEDVGQDTVPVPDGTDAFFVDGAARLVFGVPGDDATVWSVVLATGEAEALGPGAWPRPASGGRILGARRAPSGCAASYEPGVAAP
jgi:hypothetical protein